MEVERENNLAGALAFGSMKKDQVYEVGFRYKHCDSTLKHSCISVHSVGH